MLLTLRSDHKKHVSFLTEQTTQVLQDFCKLALDYLQKGPNIKLYTTAAQKLQIEVDVIKNSVEGLIYLLLESCKHKLSNEDFRDSVIALGFTNDKGTILNKLYNRTKNEISYTVSHMGFKLPEYHDIEWRFEVQVASRSLLKQVSPLITLDLALKNNDTSDIIDHILLQTDSINLLHMTQELEEALQEGHRRYTRHVSKVIK